jgi:outer membrane protein assembly factor BamC
VVPDIEDSTYDYSAKFEVPRPVSLSSAVLEDKVKIQRLSGSQWIFITNSPAEVWPQVREFLGVNGMNVAMTDPTAGVIETDWLAFTDTPEQVDRFRVRIENGVQPGSSEIHVLQMHTAADADLAAVTSWPDGSAQAEREAWLIDLLSNTLAANIERSSSSLLAQTIGGDSKVYLDNTDTNEPVLRLKLPYVRAWASVNGALQKDGFYLFGKENTLGVFYADYREPLDEGDKPGWLRKSYRGLKKVIGAEDQTAAPETPYQLDQLISSLPSTADTEEVFSRIDSNNEQLLDVPGYLLVVRGVNQDIEVRIRDGYAQKIDEREAKRLLSIVRNNLI